MAEGERGGGGGGEGECGVICTARNYWLWLFGIGGGDSWVWNFHRITCVPLQALSLAFARLTPVDAHAVIFYFSLH